MKDVKDDDDDDVVYFVGTSSVQIFVKPVHGISSRFRASRE